MLLLVGIPCTGSSRLFICFEYPGLPLDTDQACIEDNLVCNGDRDCPFGDDEWNCNTYNGLNQSCTDENGFFECVDSPARDFLLTNDSTNICIRREYSCDVNEFETWDCPNQEDLSTGECPANFTRMFSYVAVFSFLFLVCEICALFCVVFGKTA